MAITKAALKARRKRLLVLADFLEQEVALRLDGAKFDMGQRGCANEAVPDDIDKTSECGFAGCAVGWAYYCPPLVKAGVRKVVQRGDEYGDEDRLDVLDESRLDEFFGLTGNERMRCFAPSMYDAMGGDVEIGEVVSRLRQVAAADAEAAAW